MRNYIADGVSRVNKVQDLIASKKEFITKQIINAVLVLIIMIVFGCFDFAHPSFHFEYLANTSFWTGIIGKVVAVVCAYNIGINFIIDDVITKDDVLISAKVLYEKLNDCRDKDFDYFVYNIFNRRKRKEAYISKIDRQIYLLNKISKRSDRILYSNDDPNKQDLKLKNKYCIKRTELEELKKDEFIEKNLENLNVRYKDIDPAIFRLEIDSRIKSNQIQVNGSIAKGRMKSTSSVILSVVGIAAFTTALVLEPDKEQFENQAIAAMNYCLKAVADAGTIIWQLFHGMINAKNIVSQQLTNSYAGRNTVLEAYYQWRQENGKTVPQCYLDIFEEKESEEVIEMTEEELKQWRTTSNEEIR